MGVNLTEIQIVPVQPRDGLIAFCSFILDENLYLGSIGIVTRPNGGYRLVYPSKKVGERNLNIFHPINKTFAQTIEKEVVAKLEDVMNHDRHNKT